MKLRKITNADLQGIGVIGMADTPNLSARQMQEKVEEVVRAVVIPIINENIDYTATKQDVTDAVYNSGAGDMLASAYDSNLDGIVNKADNGVFVYTHSKSGTVHNLQGSGENIKFIATADWNAGDSLTINGETTHCLNNMLERIEDEELFKRNVTVTATVRAMNGYNRCFFKLGGAGLNFKIVGAATQPASPKENTIWINTSTPIKNWQFAVSQPTKRADGTALQNGDLWIKTGIDTNVEFNAVKKNAIKLKLVDSYQWNGSAWIAKTAKIYINSKWTDLSFVMYEKGVFAVNYSQSGNLGGITIGTDSIRFYNTGYPVDNNYQYINLGGEIDWSQYSTVKVTLKSYTYSGSKPCYIAIGSSKTARDLASKSMGNSSVQTLDVSNVKTKGYLNIGIQVGVQSSGTTDVYVERVEIY